MSARIGRVFLFSFLVVAVASPAGSAGLLADVQTLLFKAQGNPGQSLRVSVDDRAARGWDSQLPLNGEFEWLESSAGSRSLPTFPPGQGIPVGEAQSVDGLVSRMTTVTPWKAVAYGPGAVQVSLGNYDPSDVNSEIRLTGVGGWLQQDFDPAATTGVRGVTAKFLDAATLQPVTILEIGLHFVDASAGPGEAAAATALLYPVPRPGLYDPLTGTATIDLAEYFSIPWAAVWVYDAGGDRILPAVPDGPSGGLNWPTQLGEAGAVLASMGLEALTISQVPPNHASVIVDDVRILKDLAQDGGFEGQSGPVLDWPATPTLWVGGSRNGGNLWSPSIGNVDGDADQELRVITNFNSGAIDHRVGLHGWAGLRIGEFRAANDAGPVARRLLQQTYSLCVGDHFYMIDADRTAAGTTGPITLGRADIMSLHRQRCDAEGHLLWGQHFPGYPKQRSQTDPAEFAALIDSFVGYDYTWFQLSLRRGTSATPVTFVLDDVRVNSMPAPAPEAAEPPAEPLVADTDDSDGFVGLCAFGDECVRLRPDLIRLEYEGALGRWVVDTHCGTGDTDCDGYTTLYELMNGRNPLREGPDDQLEI